MALPPGMRPVTTGLLRTPARAPVLPPTGTAGQTLISDGGRIGARVPQPVGGGGCPLTCRPPPDQKAVAVPFGTALGFCSMRRFTQVRCALRNIRDEGFYGEGRITCRIGAVVAGRIRSSVMSARPFRDRRGRCYRRSGGVLCSLRICRWSSACVLKILPQKGQIYSPISGGISPIRRWPGESGSWLMPACPPQSLRASGRSGRIAVRW